MSRTTDQDLVADAQRASLQRCNLQRIVEGAVLMTLSTIDLSLWCYAAYNGAVLFRRL